MNASDYYLNKFRFESVGRTNSMLATATSALAVSGCGGGSGGGLITQIKGFPTSYVAPLSSYVVPTESDPNFEILKPDYIDPYWVASLEMDQWEAHILPMLADFERVLHYSFPDTPPDYDTFGLTGWEPATEEMKTATRDILSKFEDILDVTISESSDSKAINVISVSTSNQVTTAGFSYYPNNFFEIGMDIFISKEYANPNFLSELITNYEYEVLVHEIGHALGLKHPFETNGSNTAILSSYEDNTSNTAMSYDSEPTTFNSTLRPLDWMALTKFYGISPTYNADDDTYEFSSSSGIFIIDGAGIETINAYAALQDVIIDLRPGAHSYLGMKSDYITDANQLTISHGSNIENAITGYGNDIVIGNDLDNLISTGTGSDTIFAGNGIDIIKSGTGADRIDISESVHSRDIVMLDAPSVDLGIDTIYGFEQGLLGDIFDLNEILSDGYELFPLVALGSSPIANFSGGIIRLTGSDISTAIDLSHSFKTGGGFETLSMSDGANALIISANSQSTGEDQYIFSAESTDGQITIAQLAILHGNFLDIDQWHIDNFSIFA